MLRAGKSARRWLLRGDDERSGSPRKQLERRLAAAGSW
jgi:hypothetical protein